MADIHIEQQQLPANGEPVKPQWFKLPASSPGCVFYVEYTAHASSVNARPIWRVTSSPDGVHGENERAFPEPIRSTEGDITVAPNAIVEQFKGFDIHPVAVAPNVTERIQVRRERKDIPDFFRLEIAEYGDLVNRGTVKVEVSA